MTHIYDDRPEAAQLRARQVGDAAARLQPPHVSEDAARADKEIDQLVERVRWLMRREPVLEREMQQM